MRTGTFVVIETENNWYECFFYFDPFFPFDLFRRASSAVGARFFKGRWGQYLLSVILSRPKDLVFFLAAFAFLPLHGHSCDGPS